MGFWNCQLMLINGLNNYVEFLTGILQKIFKSKSVLNSTVKKKGVTYYKKIIANGNMKKWEQTFIEKNTLEC